MPHLCQAGTSNQSHATAESAETRRHRQAVKIALTLLDGKRPLGPRGRSCVRDQEFQVQRDYVQFRLEKQLCRLLPWTWASQATISFQTAGTRLSAEHLLPQRGTARQTAISHGAHQPLHQGRHQVSGPHWGCCCRPARLNQRLGLHPFGGSTGEYSSKEYWLYSSNVSTRALPLEYRHIVQTRDPLPTGALISVLISGTVASHWSTLLFRAYHRQ